MSTKELMKRRTTNTARNAELKVAQFANKRTAPDTKREARLARRVQSWLRTTDDPKGPSVDAFHKPGSLSK